MRDPAFLFSSNPPECGVFPRLQRHALRRMPCALATASLALLAGCAIEADDYGVEFAHVVEQQRQRHHIGQHRQHVER